MGVCVTVFLLLVGLWRFWQPVRPALTHAPLSTPGIAAITPAPDFALPRELKTAASSRIFPGKYPTEQVFDGPPRVFPRKYSAESKAGALPYPAFVPRQPAAPSPTPTPSPTPSVPAPTALTGPRALRLWTGDEIAVQPATLHWEAPRGVSRWRVPDTAAGWHTNTADCGGGVTIIGGHVAYSGRAGVFAPLATIGPEGDVHCTDQHGHVRRFRPVDYLVSSQHISPAAWQPDWSPALLLYTCTPELDGQLIVVRFEEVEG